MNNRSGDAGPVLPVRRVTVAVGIVAAGDHLDVALPADIAFGDPGSVVKPVRVDFDGAPGDTALGIIAAWVSNPLTGVVTVRFCALAGPTAAVPAQKLVVSLLSVP